MDNEGRGSSGKNDTRNPPARSMKNHQQRRRRRKRSRGTQHQQLHCPSNSRENVSSLEPSRKRRPLNSGMVKDPRHGMAAERFIRHSALEAAAVERNRPTLHNEKSRDADPKLHRRKQPLIPRNRLRRRRKADRKSSTLPQQTLVWASEPHVPLKAEEDMLCVLILNQRERGMICAQLKERQRTISTRCKSSGMQLPQALSLRRHHIKLLNPNLGMEQLRLGAERHIRQSAELFERAVEASLRRTGLDFITEQQQRRRSKGPSLPTPDFMLGSPVSLHVTRPNRSDDTKEGAECVIHWVEAKMFYGASTIPSDSVGAVGCILRTARKYTRLFGPGAMVFMYGCGDKLANQLLTHGVVALDAYPVDLRHVWSHQRTWCANEDGTILP